MRSRTRANRAFVSAIILLCICGVATSLSFSYLRASERWLSHTQEVRGGIGDVESTISFAARARMSYLMSGSPADLTAYRNAVAHVPEEIRKLRVLTRDNKTQQENCDQLATVTNARLKDWEAAVVAKSEGKEVNLADLLQQSISLSSQGAVAGEAIRTEELRLLLQRTLAAQRQFFLAIAAVVTSFVFAILLLYLHYRLLTSELYAREEAEKIARNAYEREAVMRREQERFRLFVDAVEDYAIYVLDPEGHVASWNRGAQRIKGYAASEIIGQHFSAFFTEQDRIDGKPLQELQIAERDGQFRNEGWRVRKDGSQFWANVVLTAIKDEKGKLSGFSKITRDFTERMQAQERLRRANTDLAVEVKERMSAQEKLANSENSLRELSLHLLKTQDEERRRIGRELHDSLGQYLAMLKMNLDSLDADLVGSNNGAGEQVGRCIRLVEDSIKEVRTISYLLYPPMLEEVGLKSAIPWYLEGFSKRSNIQTTFETDPEFGRLGREVELALFRVLQESLTNVHRHSGSTTADIRLTRQNGSVVLQVTDKGKGIPPALLKQSDSDWLGSLGVGLRGMNERIRQLGGKLEISSTEGGTVVTAGVPVVEPVTALSNTD
jgi:PAS domain S-box-containing protein